MRPKTTVTTDAAAAECRLLALYFVPPGILRIYGQNKVFIFTSITCHGCRLVCRGEWSLDGYLANPLCYIVYYAIYMFLLVFCKYIAGMQSLETHWYLSARSRMGENEKPGISREIM